ncbi:MAG: peptidase [Deltaproteobacteria bacterium]|nr:peptidase [Deltaproteobacteria bacterium]
MILLCFVDGVGVGERDPARNPLARTPTLLSHFLDGSHSRPLPPEARFRAIDANLGLPGRPQSATGQASLLTGQNAGAFMGSHVTGFPGPKLRAFVEQHGLLARLSRRGRSVAFLNAYHTQYLNAVGFPQPPPRRPEPPLTIPRLYRHPSVTTVATHAAGILFRTFDDVLEGRAVFHDVTLAGPRGRGFDLPAVEPIAAGRILAAEREHLDLGLFEFFLTDKAGHDQDFEAAEDALLRLEGLLQGALEGLDLSRDTLVVTSDHGNLEDLSVRTHTRNPIPLLAVGARAGAFLAVSALPEVAGVVERSILDTL